MSEYISKQTALDMLKMIKAEVDDGDGFLYDEWKHRVQTLPSKMLVKCKDCKNYYISTNWCDCHLSVMKSDDFCSYGARMDGES